MGGLTMVIQSEKTQNDIPTFESELTISPKNYRILLAMATECLELRKIVDTLMSQLEYISLNKK